MGVKFPIFKPYLLKLSYLKNISKQIHTKKESLFIFLNTASALFTKIRR